jgi:hypothetical protein
MSNEERGSENGSARSKRIGGRDGAATKPKGSKMDRRKNRSGEDARTIEPKRCAKRKNGTVNDQSKKRGSRGKENGRQTNNRKGKWDQSAHQAGSRKKHRANSVQVRGIWGMRCK